MNRRDFLKLAGILSGSAAASSCELHRTPEKLIPYLVPPDEGLVPGEPTWVRSTCTECPAGCGLQVKLMDGRPVKLEGNPDHPLNRGALCVRGQAALERLYHPLRFREPMRRQGSKLVPETWASALGRVRTALDQASRSGLQSAYVSGRTTGSLAKLIQESCATLGIEKTTEVEALTHGAIRAANRMVFGRAVVPEYKLDQADVVLTVGADLLGTFGNPVEFGRKFARARARGLQWYHAEPHLTLTGMQADQRIVLRPGGESTLLGFLLDRIEGRPLPAEVLARLAPPRPDAVSHATGLDKAALDRLAATFREARAPMVVAGGVCTAIRNTGLHVALLAALMQYRMGMGATTLDLVRSETLDRVGPLQPIGDADPLGVVFLSRVYGLELSPALRAQIGKAKLVVGLSDLPSAATDLCHIVLSTSHGLESWGDAEPKRGLRSVIQPALTPMYDTRAEGDILLALMGLNTPAYQQYLLRRWNSVDDRWLSRGVREEALAAEAEAPGMDAAAVIDTLDRLPGSKVFEGALVLTPSVRTHDGRSDALELLHEIPDPLSTVTYGEFFSISEDEASKLGLQDGQVAELTAADIKLSLPVRVQPALPAGVRMLELGAVKGLKLPFDERTGELVGCMPATLAASSRRERLPVMSGSVDGAEERFILPDRGAQVGHGQGHGDATLYPDHEHENYRWGMVIDLDRCTGCSACVAACYIENNVPIVGRGEHLKGREMAWLRIQPYRTGAGKLQFLPMMCQHCDHAPCEPVCPVYATYHNPEGLNAQVYNRCVGTRYCSNNCPYKARRFNWFEHPRPEPLQLLANPDVSRRPKGVMEKCTFCIQRIRYAKDVAKGERRLVRDGEVVPACAQTCPTGAITFGSLMDPDSRVSRLMTSPRAYRVLELLGTRPAVTYLSDAQLKGGRHG